MLPVNGQMLIDLIPQKPPFVLISSLQEVSEQKGVTTFHFSGEHPMCTNNYLTVGGLIENMAQTCAAKAGYENFLLHQPIPLGFIGDVKDFYFSRLPFAGEELRTEIKVVNKIFDFTIITGKIFVEAEEIASCRMKIFIEPEKHEIVERK